MRIFGAIWANLQSRSVRQGASTITQQLVKVTLLEPEQTLRRKVKEMAISIWLELYLGKEKILEHYLNSIYLGHGHYGMERASQAYFQKNVNDLTLAQAAFLAALIKKPEHYLRISELKTGRKYFSLEELKDVNQRQRSILRSMLDLEWIDDQTFQRASDEKLNVLHRKVHHNFLAHKFVPPPHLPSRKSAQNPQNWNLVGNFALKPLHKAEVLKPSRVDAGLGWPY